MERYLLDVLRSSHHINQLKQIHALILTRYPSFTSDFVMKLIGLSHLKYARKLFDKMPQPDERLYNMFISAYSRVGSYKQVVGMFCLMRRKNTHITSYSVPPVLKSCSMNLMAELGKQVHSMIINFGLESNRFVQTALMDLYARSGDLKSAKVIFDGILDRDPICYNCLISGYSKSGNVLAARRLFDEMPERTVVSWNSMICCYANSGDHHEAMRIFEMMQEESCRANEFTMATVLSICGNVGDLDLGWKLKKYAEDNNMLSNMIVSTALMEMFVKCGAVSDAREVFDRMNKRDYVTWGSMIAGYAQNGRADEALELYKCMANENIKPNDVTLASVLSACAQLGSLEAGEQINSYIESEGLESNIYVASALLSMYLRCGSMKQAWRVFNQMYEKDVVCWNTMISGLAFNGYATDAILLFERMKKANIRPNGVTFSSLLTACTHAGLIDLGLELFNSMQSNYNISPDVEHYACVVDLFCRNGRLDEAYNFICQMEGPNAVTWGTLLSSCRFHSNIELAEIALMKLLELEPENSGNYVLLSNIYADTGRWQDALRVRNLLQKKKVQKNAAYSWIELDDGMHKFLVADSWHPRCSEIYEVVVGLAMLSSDETDTFCEY